MKFLIFLFLAHRIFSATCDTNCETCVSDVCTKCKLPYFLILTTCLQNELKYPILKIEYRYEILY